VIVSPDEVKPVSRALEDQGETTFVIGFVEAGPRGCTVAGPAGSWSARGDWAATHNG
jgi:phosphoribosylformylglycinamidine cyclo-ligase